MIDRGRNRIVGLAYKQQYGIINIQSVREDYKMSESVNIVEEILNKRKLDQWEIFLQKSSNFRLQTKQSKTDLYKKRNFQDLQYA